jgi:uncharacterized protein HemY
MRPELQHLMQQVAAIQSLDFPEVSRFEPADFRQGIQWLVAQDNTAMALALADAGLSLYPQSEDVLAIAGLLAMTQQDWPAAIELLQDLCTVQQGNVQAMTYHMLARALSCNLDLAEARQVLARGLAAWPDDATLLAEQADMALAPVAFSAAGLSN